MIKVEIEVSGFQEERLRALARDRGVSFDEAVKICVAEALAAPDRDRKALYARAARLIGTFEDPEGATDLSVRHDHYLYDS